MKIRSLQVLQKKLQTEFVVQLRVMRGGALSTCRAMKETGAKEKPEFAP